jgi:hypothetical protein
MIAMLLLVAIATIGAIGIAIETGTQSAQARFFSGNDNTQGNDNSGGNVNTGGNEHGNN